MLSTYSSWIYIISWCDQPSGEDRTLSFWVGKCINQKWGGRAISYSHPFEYESENLNYFICPCTVCSFTDKPECNCHFPATGRNCMTHSQMKQDFPNMCQVLLHKNNKISLPTLMQFLPRSRKWQLHSGLSVSAMYINSNYEYSVWVIITSLWV
jgi:hypothetical protein